MAHKKLGMTFARESRLFTSLLVGLVAAGALLAGPQAFAQAEDLDEPSNAAVGAQLYANNCQYCHQADGHGEASLYPSLQRTAILSNQDLLLQTILHGRVDRSQADKDQGKRLMPAWGFLSDREIVALIEYITEQWGTKTITVEAAAIARARARFDQ